MDHKARFGRRCGLVAALACAALSWWMAGSDAFAQAHADTTDVLLYPPAPCAEDTVTVFVRGYVATPCDSFVSAERVDDRTIVIRRQVHTDRFCFAPPLRFFSVPVVMGRFAEGAQEIQIWHQTILVTSGGSPDTVSTSSTLAFEVTADCPPPPTIPADQLPYVWGVTTVPSPPCPDRPTTVHVAGVFRDGCGRVVSVDPSTLSLVIAPHPPTEMACTLALKPWSADFPLGLLARGHHRVAIRMTVLGNDLAWPPVPTQTYIGVFDFDVVPACGPTLLPYVDFIRVVPKRPCGQDARICPGDSIVVLLGGTFPSECFRVTGFELVDPGYGSPIPMPPIVRLSVSDEGCSRRACSDSPVPWSISGAFGPLLAGEHQLVVEEVRHVGCPPVEDRHTALVPFTVSEPGNCPVPDCALCLLPVWLSSSGQGACHAYISPGGTTTVDLAVHTPVALAGLEGSLSSELSITKLEAIGPAAGMHLTMTRTLDGVRFVMFASQGAPIPATVTDPPASVLRVTVALPNDATALRHYLRTGMDVLGSDIHGQAVRMCIPPWDRFALPTAVICVKRGECDFNADGTLDVRDLVLMVHCVNDPASCPPELDSRFDCDGNGRFELADVICCAFELLHGPVCPECVGDSVRPAPEVSVGFGSPRSVQGGVEVPLRINGAGMLGGAHLRLRYPEDRFVVTAVEGDPAWIILHQESGSDLSIGLLDSGAPLAMIVPSPTADLLVRLALRPGAGVGGELKVTEGVFSGPDGVRLEVAMGEPRLLLGAAATIELSPARPNPFSGETRFTVTLERPGALDVGIYDLAGRRVATLFHGGAAAGPLSLVWDGRDADGRRVPGGVYFYRALAGGVSATRRMIMLQGR